MPDFKKVATVAEVPQGEMKLVEVDGQEIVIANVDGAFYVFAAECTHMGGPLADGFLVNDVVECPWHGGQFDVKTGQVVAPPPPTPLPTYAVQVEGSDIQVAFE
ncbi:MAG TPA: non-heme iron oxygenase ferredoxin subunit [Dehalococcoidia bacterium]|nr:non-heme iron oxygenase ferredoxin subunit [Dehalococcoidia bacterium]